VRRKVETGGGGMPSFAGKLSDAQIRDVAAFVSAR
jgi:mono/diheme cytochrome c family protein